MHNELGRWNCTEKIKDYTKNNNEGSYKEVSGTYSVSGNTDSS